MRVPIIFVGAGFISLIAIPNYYSDVWVDAPSLFFFWVLVFLVSIGVLLIYAIGECLNRIARFRLARWLFSVPLLLFSMLSSAVWAFSLMEGRLLFVVPSVLYLAVFIAVGKTMSQERAVG